LGVFLFSKSSSSSLGVPLSSSDEDSSFVALSGMGSDFLGVDGVDFGLSLSCLLLLGSLAMAAAI
jgi:hypothetical protein